MKNGEAIGLNMWRLLMTFEHLRRAVRIPSCCALGSDQRSMNGVMADSSFGEFGSKEKEGGSHVPRMKQG